MKNIKTQRTILAVDDVMVNLTAAKAILQDYYNVCLAKSGKEALSILEHTQADLILLDIEMPEMSGIEVFATLQEDPVRSSIPVIFVTASASAEMVKQVVTMGAKDYIVKPIAANLLLDKIESAILSMKVDPATVFLVEHLKQLEKACIEYARPKINSLLQTILENQYISTIAIMLQRVSLLIRNNDFRQAAGKVRELVVYLEKD
jgi:putative two-component system response regulator